MFGEEQFRSIQSLLAQLIRVGRVSSTNDEQVTARVLFEDQSKIVSYDLPVLVRNSLKNKDYWMPDINEQVLCVFLPIGVEQGFILGSFYSKQTAPPAQDKNKRVTVFEDGTSVEYDRESGILTVNVKKDVVVNSETKVIVNSPEIDLGEDSALEPSVLGDKIAAALDDLRTELDNHTHIGNLGAPTSPAMAVQPFQFIDLLNGGESYSKKNRNQ